MGAGSRGVGLHAVNAGRDAWQPDRALAGQHSHGRGETGEFFWRVSVVLFLLAIMSGHRQLDPAELIAVMAIAMSVGTGRTDHRDCASSAGFPRHGGAFETSRWRSSALHFWVASILEAANQYFDVILVYWMLDPATAGIYFRRLPPRQHLRHAVGRTVQLWRAAAPLAVLQQEPPGVRANVAAHGGSDRTLCVASGLLLIWIGGPHLLNLFGPHFAAQHWVLIVLAIGTAHSGGGRSICGDLAADRL